MEVQTNKDDHPLAVSVVVPVLNEERDIGRLLEELVNQTPPVGGFEVIVVDGGSTDKTRELVTTVARRHRNVGLVENRRRLSSSGRNVGVRSARGRFVLFVDGHCSVPRRDYLRLVVELFESSGAGCLCRPQPLDHLTGTDWMRAIAAARHSWIGHHPRSDVYSAVPGFTDPMSAGAAYDRRYITELGGFDERFDACEDVEFNCRIAQLEVPSYVHPGLAIYYRPRSSLKELWKQMARYGRGRARLWARHPRQVPWPLIAAVAVPTLVGVALPFFQPAAIAAYALAFALWAGLVWATSCRNCPPNTGTWRVALALVAIHSGLVVGFIVGLSDYGRFHRADPSQGVGLRSSSSACSDA